jgi:hypothetical protein
LTLYVLTILNNSWYETVLEAEEPSYEFCTRPRKSQAQDYDSTIRKTKRFDLYTLCNSSCSRLFSFSNRLDSDVFFVLMALGGLACIIWYIFLTACKIPIRKEQEEFLNMNFLNFEFSGLFV